MTRQIVKIVCFCSLLFPVALSSSCLDELEGGSANDEVLANNQSGQDSENSGDSPSSEDRPSERCSQDSLSPNHTREEAAPVDLNEYGYFILPSSDHRICAGGPDFLSIELRQHQRMGNRLLDRDNQDLLLYTVYSPAGEILYEEQGSIDFQAPEAGTYTLRLSIPDEDAKSYGLHMTHYCLEDQDCAEGYACHPEALRCETSIDPSCGNDPERDIQTYPVSPFQIDWTGEPFASAPHYLCKEDTDSFVLNIPAEVALSIEFSGDGTFRSVELSKIPEPRAHWRDPNPESDFETQTVPPLEEIHHTGTLSPGRYLLNISDFISPGSTPRPYSFRISETLE